MVIPMGFRLRFSQQNQSNELNNRDVLAITDSDSQLVTKQLMQPSQPLCIKIMTLWSALAFRQLFERGFRCINHVYPINFGISDVLSMILPMCQLMFNLVGGFNHSEKYEFVSWDYDIPNIWKVMFQAMFQSTNQ